MLWVVGITKTCERLGIFSSQKSAEEFIGTLPNHEDGRYYIDGPCENIILQQDNRDIENEDEDDYYDYRESPDPHWMNP